MRWLDSWVEMFDVLARNKLRTALTALSVAWGIFMLVLLLGAGQGLQNGVQHDFRDDAVNSIWISGAKTSLPYQGNAPGRPVRFTNSDFDAVEREIRGIEHITGRFYLWGEFSVSYGGESAPFDIRGCHPDHQYLERTLIVEGRFINERDIRERRKVAVIGPDVQKTLFGDTPPIGEYLSIRGVKYRIVGIFMDEGSQGELKKIYIPISTAQLVYSGQDRVDHIMFTLSDPTLEESQRMMNEAQELLARRHRFSPEDRRALHVNNNLERFFKVTQVFDWIRAFVWIVGIGTILAGMISVGNIMLISVKERTLEIGIRKAIGATPGAIVRMVLQESLFITSLSGYLGLLAGAVLIELVRRYLPENQYLRDPELDFRAALIATALLVVAGALAGLIPALRAARVKPVVAMRGE